MRHAALLIAAFLAGSGPANAQSAAPIDGRWINPDKTVIIAISPCGETRCGIVDWATEVAQQDAAKHDPRLIGSALLTDLVPGSGNQWKGNLFIPDQNMKVTAKISAEGADSIKVEGCALGGFVCKSQSWTRFTGPNP